MILGTHRNLRLQENRYNSLLVLSVNIQRTRLPSRSYIRLTKEIFLTIKTRTFQTPSLRRNFLVELLS